MMAVEVMGIEGEKINRLSVRRVIKEIRRRSEVDNEDFMYGVKY